MRKLIFALCLGLFLSSFADEVIWSGKVSSSGEASPPIVLILKEKYQIKVSGSINLGKWIQGGEELADDACFEYSKEGKTTSQKTLRNSLDIALGDGSYHRDHVYQSQPFSAQQNKIFFWVWDTNYEDNSGSFDVTVSRVN